jgi:hypothetical protein
VLDPTGDAEQREVEGRLGEGDDSPPAGRFVLVAQLQEDGCEQQAGRLRGSHTMRLPLDGGGKIHTDLRREVRRENHVIRSTIDQYESRHPALRADDGDGDNWSKAGVTPVQGGDGRR